MPIYTSIDQLPMELNIRDLGGIPTKDGRHIKKGMLFRSSALAFSNESFQFMFDRLLAGKAPLMFHCANGKDRTGVAAMLLLLALGADEKAVKEDFLMSNLNRRARIDEAMKKYRIISGRSGNARSFLTMLRGVLPEAADMMMSEILERYETYENFMEKEYRFDKDKLEKFRSMYLE